MGHDKLRIIWFGSKTGAVTPTSSPQGAIQQGRTLDPRRGVWSWHQIHRALYNRGEHWIQDVGCDPDIESTVPYDKGGHWIQDAGCDPDIKATERHTTGEDTGPKTWAVIPTSSPQSAIRQERTESRTKKYIYSPHCEWTRLFNASPDETVKHYAELQ